MAWLRWHLRHGQSPLSVENPDIAEEISSLLDLPLAPHKWNMGIWDEGAPWSLSEIALSYAATELAAPEHE